MIGEGARVLIAGCGDVGNECGRRLSGLGMEVFGVRRNAAAVDACINAIACDLTKPEALRAVPKDVDAVIYCMTPGERSETRYRAVFVEAQQRLIDHLSGLSRWIFVSSTSVYGQSGGEWVDETSATEPSRYNGRVLLEGEQVAQRSGLDYTNVRFGGIYGPGRMRLLSLVERCEPCVESPAQYTNRIHRDDCAELLVFALRTDLEHQLFLGVDDYPAPAHEVRDWLADQLEVDRPPRNPTPSAVGSKRCANARIRQAGYRFVFPTFREGFVGVLKSRRSNAVGANP